MKKNNKKEKINTIMVNQKNIKNFKIDSGSDDENILKKFIVISIVIAVIAGVVYGVTEMVKDEPKDNDAITSGSINYDKTSVGTILNRPYNEYYVLLYNSEDNDAVLYSTMLTKYMQNKEKDDYVKIYFCDLNNSLNKQYYNINNDDISNPKAKSVEEFDFGDLTLLKIKDSKVGEYKENYKDIKEILK